MVASTARKVTQELQEGHREEQALDVSRVVEDAVSVEVGARVAAWKPPPRNYKPSSDETVESISKMREVRADRHEETKAKKTKVSKRKGAPPSDD